MYVTSRVKIDKSQGCVEKDVYDFNISFYLDAFIQMNCNELQCINQHTPKCGNIIQAY